MEMLATIEQTSSKCPEEALSIMMPRSSKALSTIGFFLILSNGQENFI